MNVNIYNQTIWSFKLKVMLVRHVRYRLIRDYTESEIVREETGKRLNHYVVFSPSPSFPLRDNSYCVLLPKAKRGRGFSSNQVYIRDIMFLNVSDVMNSKSVLRKFSWLDKLSFDVISIINGTIKKFFFSFWNT